MAEALAVKDGKVLAVGSRAELEKAHKGTETRIVDLQGKTLLPGFLDADSHYMSSLTVANQVNVYAPPAGPGKDPASIVAELVKFRDTHKIPKGEIIQAYGYDENVMPKGSHLNRGHLDAALPDHPPPSRKSSGLGPDRRSMPRPGSRPHTKAPPKRASSNS